MKIAVANFDLDGVYFGTVWNQNGTITFRSYIDDIPREISVPAKIFHGSCWGIDIRNAIQFLADTGDAYATVVDYETKEIIDGFDYVKGKETTFNWNRHYGDYQSERELIAEYCNLRTKAMIYMALDLPTFSDDGHLWAGVVEQDIIEKENWSGAIINDALLP